MRTKTLKDIEDIIELSLTAKHSKSYPCSLVLNEDGEKFRAYEVSIANRDLLFFTDKGTLNYLVDSFGDQTSIELFNMERDDD
jgi:hypothetical protein